MIEILDFIYATFIYSVRHGIAAHVFDLPAVFATTRAFSDLHHPAVFLLLRCIVYGLGINRELCTYGMCRRMMTTRSLPRTQPYGGIVPFGTTETGRDRIQHLLAIFKIVHVWNCCTKWKKRSGNSRLTCSRNSATCCWLYLHVSWHANRKLCRS